jgi:hypothetical protein
MSSFDMFLICSGVADGRTPGPVTPLPPEPDENASGGADGVATVGFAVAAEALLARVVEAVETGRGLLPIVVPMMGHCRTGPPISCPRKTTGTAAVCKAVRRFVRGSSAIAMVFSSSASASSPSSQGDGVAVT